MGNNKGGNNRSKKEIEYIKEIIKKLKSGKVEKEFLIVKTQLKKPISEYKAITPHVIAAKKMVERKMPLDFGSMIEYYIGGKNEKKKLVRDRVMLSDEPGIYDVDYYLHHQILPAVENIFQVFNINITEIIEGKKQMTLGEF